MRKEFTEFTVQQDSQHVSDTTRRKKPGASRFTERRLTTQRKGRWRGFSARMLRRMAAPLRAGYHHHRTRSNASSVRLQAQFAWENAHGKPAWHGDSADGNDTHRAGSPGWESPRALAAPSDSCHQRLVDLGPARRRAIAGCRDVWAAG